ncbi:MAG: sulfate adenylyltransferase [Acidimicrobiaceae bacterium]|nr:sulfate adenylyltransferase [Acidimicrobiaceae bacterium]
MAIEDLISPHGGKLKQKVIVEPDQTSGSVSLELTPRQFADLEMISIGAYSPLETFMNKSDYYSVIESMHLADGTLWPIPITFQIHSSQIDTTTTTIHLTRNFAHVATLEVDEVYKLDHELEASHIYGTTSVEHPGVKLLFSGGDLAVTGELMVHIVSGAYEGPEYLTPADTRGIFRGRNWKSVAAFQTRNPVHRAHEYLHKIALEIVDGLFLNPLVGQTKLDDVPVPVRMAAYSVLLEKYYPQNRTILGVYPAAMRYAGPQEAILHAISRKNYGCTHFIVGRDHAGVGNYYSTYAAQEIFETIVPEELGISILKFEHSYYCSVCCQVASKRTCPHGPESHISLSGTRVRELLANGEDLPPEFSRPEVAAILRLAYQK